MSIKKNAKKVAVIVAVAFLIALAGPVVMSVALGTDSVGVISAAYIQPVTGGGNNVFPSTGGGNNVFPSTSGGNNVGPSTGGGNNVNPG